MPKLRHNNVKDASLVPQLPHHANAALQVGVMHTNYKELGRRIAGPLVVPFLHVMMASLCAIHCHKVCVIYLSIPRRLAWAPFQHHGTHLNISQGIVKHVLHHNLLCRVR